MNVVLAVESTGWSVLFLCPKRSFASLGCSLVRQTLHVERGTLDVNASTFNTHVNR